MIARKDLPQLVRRAREGDPDAWTRLVEAYRPRLAGLARRLQSPLLEQRTALEDLVQEILLAAWRGLSRASFASAGDFEAWLVRVGRNRILDLEREGRSQKRGGALQREVPDASAVADLARTTGSPSRPMQRREQAQGLAELLDRLPVAYREVLLLVRLEGLPTSVVATRLGLAPATVRKRLERALALCRDRLGGPSTDRPARRREDA